MKIKSGDTVTVIAGKDKGRKGKVLKVYPQKERVAIEGVNEVTKHLKSRGDNKGGIIKKHLSIHVSNVMLMDSSGKPTRVGSKIEGGKKVRVAKSDGKKV